MRQLAALSLAALAAGCNLTNDTVLLATLVQTPAPPPGLGVPVTQTALAQVYLGQTSITSPSAGDVSPISGATVKLVRTPIGGAPTEFVLAETQPGWYQRDGDLYQATATYRFVARVGSDEYWGEVQNAPSAPAMTLPAPSSTPSTDVYQYNSYGTNMPSPFPVGRTCPPLALCDVAFYGVWTVTGTTVSGTPNCTNAPQDVGELLQVAYLNDLPWRVPEFSLDKGACFPVPAPASWPRAWLAGLTALKRGTTSGNTSIASVVLVGTSDAAGVIASAP